MRKIFKYKLDMGYTTLLMPSNATVLTCQPQQEQPCIWVMVEDSKAEAEHRTFVMYGTGHPIDWDVTTLKFINTLLLSNDKLVLHVFEVLK